MPDHDPYAPMFADPVGPWHRWFAWRPVSTIDRGLVWLRFVWCRRVQSHAYLDGPTWRGWQRVVDAHRGARDS